MIGKWSVPAGQAVPEANGRQRTMLTIAKVTFVLSLVTGIALVFFIARSNYALQQGAEIDEKNRAGIQRLEEITAQSKEMLENQRKIIQDLRDAQAWQKEQMHVRIKERHEQTAMLEKLIEQTKPKDK